MQSNLGFVIFAALALSSLATNASAGDQECTADKYGHMVCPQADASCLADRNGAVFCSKPGGGIDLDNQGLPTCGPGYCTRNQEGTVFCSSVPRGAASTDAYGKVACTTSCVRATPQMCVKPKPAS